MCDVVTFGAALALALTPVSSVDYALTIGSLIIATQVCTADRAVYSASKTEHRRLDGRGRAAPSTQFVPVPISRRHAPVATRASCGMFQRQVITPDFPLRAGRSHLAVHLQQALELVAVRQADDRAAAEGAGRTRFPPQARRSWGQCRRPTVAGLRCEARLVADDVHACCQHAERQSPPPCAARRQRRRMRHG